MELGRRDAGWTMRISAAALVILLTPIAMVAGFVLPIVATVKGWI